MGATEELAQLVAQIQYEDLPPSLIQRAKWAMLDGLATTLAGCTEPAGAIVTGIVRELAGAPVATVIGKGVRTSAPWATYANDTTAHALDQDDVSWPMGGHPTAPLGTFGATAAAGKLLNLPAEELQPAFDIAASEASGIKENFGTMTKPLHVGHCAKNGLLVSPRDRAQRAKYP